MVLWVVIILVMGIFLSFFSDFIIWNKLVWPSGLIISLISLGIIMRMFYLMRRGEREKLVKKLKELEEKKEGNVSGPK